MCNKNSRAPLLANKRNQVDVSCAQLTHTHTQRQLKRTKDPLTALAIGVSSSVDLSVGEQERAEATPKITQPRDSLQVGGAEGGMCCALSVLLLIAL